MSTTSNGTNQDWASLIHGMGQGASEGLRSSTQYAQTKKDQKELKRRTYADLLKNALRRDLAMYRADTGHQNDMTNLQGDALQQVARGFSDSLRSIKTSR